MQGEPALRWASTSVRFASSTASPSTVQSTDVRGVSTKPGATALTRMRLAPNSAAAVRVSWITAALVMP
jgi:hypothetical protein